MDLLILPGDGIGPEIVSVAVAALESLDRTHQLGLTLLHRDAGLTTLASEGSTLPDEVARLAKTVDGVLLGPVSTEHYPPADEGGINLSAWFRKTLDLYANIRPSMVRPGVPAHVPEMDLVIVRENTEGFYADRNMAVGSGEFMPSHDMALAIGKLTREGCRRIARTAFELARRRRGHVTAVHKANVLHLYYGLFLEEVRGVAAEFPEVTLETVIVDAMAALLVRRPGTFDVVVTTNMFGDILSDEASELAGGLGLGASLNAGAAHAVAQAAHGSAPDIAGRDIANPSAFLHSTAMLLDHLSARHGNPALGEAARRLAAATDGLLSKKETRTADLGGDCGTRAFGEALVAVLDEA
jgi:3-isopropylmalate dehydrogenase